MPRPRGHTATRVQPNSRAIVREAEWMIMPQRIATEIKPLIDLAKDQGWRITGSNDGTKLVWRGPNGEGPVYTSYRVQSSRDLNNYRTQLVRAGLKLDEKQAKEHVSDTNFEELVEASATHTVEQVLDALNVVMINVASYAAKAEEYEEARKQTQEWKEFAEEAVDEAAKTKKKLAEADAIIIGIRDCFKLQPWAILPEIARLLGIDANNPPVPTAGSKA